MLYVSAHWCAFADDRVLIDSWNRIDPVTSYVYNHGAYNRTFEGVYDFAKGGKWKKLAPFEFPFANGV